MSHGNQSYLRFSLEESVWFQKGQEVDELVSISLDPLITIKESDQYVTIKGSLELTGEYNREQADVVEETDYFTNPKLIQTVELREEGVHLFSHRFPVEITIPKNRIEDLNDIQVTVETFDYAFPEKSCLRLSADLMISGLYGEQQHELIQDEPEHEAYEFEAIYRELDIPEVEYSERKNPFAKPQFADEESSEVYKPFEVEARKDPKAEIQYDNQAEEFEQEEANLDKVNQSEYIYERKDINPFITKKTYMEEASLQEFVNYDEEVQEDNESEKEKASFPEIVFSAKRSEEPIQAPVIEEKVDVKTEAVQENIVEEAAENVKPLKMEEMMEEIEEEESPSDSPPKKKSKKLKNKQSLTLSEFFARKAEEEHTRVTMCIVQNGETLDIISERYDVPVPHIQRVNQMELNQDIYEGQVLYIPIAQTLK